MCISLEFVVQSQSFVIPFLINNSLLIKYYSAPSLTAR